MILSASVRASLSNHFTLDVSLAIDPGVTILFGASGSGKTTLLRCIAGFVTPETGRIAIAERVLFDASRGFSLPVPARQVGYVFQQLALFPHLSVEDNIGYGLPQLDTATRRARVGAIAESFHIGHLLNRRPATISGGERQRVALARSLVTDPLVLLLDEPLSALDYGTQSKIIADLRAWTARRQIPILYVTHSQREVFALGERVLVLDKGRIAADGTPDAVMEAQAQDAIAELSGYENLFDAVVVKPNIESGTMECRLSDGLDIEVPLFAAPAGTTITLALRAGDILIGVEEPRGLSARNVLPGTIRSLHSQGTTVVATVDARHPFEVHLTPGAIHTLALAKGTAVWLVIKTHSFRRVARDVSTAARPAVDS